MKKDLLNMQATIVEAEQLDEGIKDLFGSMVNTFRRNNVKQLRSKFMKKGENRIFASEDVNGNFHVSIFEGTQKRDEKSFSDVRQADQFLEKFKKEGYKVASKPNDFKKAASWIGSVLGGGAALTSSFALGSSSFVFMEFLAGFREYGVDTNFGIALTSVIMFINFTMAAGGWAVHKISTKKREQMRQDANVVDLAESAPPTEKAEEWIKKNKERFEREYGEDSEEVLYRTAWSLYKKGSL